MGKLCRTSSLEVVKEWTPIDPSDPQALAQEAQNLKAIASLPLRAVIKRLTFTVYSVKCIEVSRKFYKNVLGLKYIEQLRKSLIEYDIGGTCFGITNF